MDASPGLTAGDSPAKLAKYKHKSITERVCPSVCVRDCVCVRVCACAENNVWLHVDKYSCTVCVSSLAKIKVAVVVVDAVAVASAVAVAVGVLGNLRLLWQQKTKSIWFKCQMKY